MNKSRIAELFFLVSITVAVFFLYFFLQPVVTYDGCQLCDGNQYWSMFDFFEGKLLWKRAAFPYYSRIFVPFLASLLPGDDVLLSFQIINLLFSVASVIAIYLLWKKLGIPLYLILIGLFWLLFHWTGIIRLNALDAITVDVPTYLIQTLFIFIVLKRKFNFLYLLGPVAVLQRESIIVLLLVLLIFAFIHNCIFKEEERIPVVTILLVLLLTIFIKYLYTSVFPPVDPGKSSVRLVLFYIKEVWYDPFKVVRWVVGIFMAFGAFFLLALQKAEYKKTWTSPFMLFLSLMTLTYFALGIIAGGDSTRIVFLGFPFIMTWILLQLKPVSWILTGIALLMSTILMKLVGIIPDPGKDFYAFAQWYPEFAEPERVWIWGSYGAGCFLILFITNKFLRTK